MFRIHFEDEYGQGAYDVKTYDETLKEVKELRKFGCCSNIWLENLSEPNGLRKWYDSISKRN